MCQQCTRRVFLGSAAAGGLLLASSRVAASGAGAAHTAKPAGKVRICTIFAGSCGEPGRNWVVTEGEMAAMKARMVEAEKNLGDVEFVIGQAGNGAEAAALLAKAGDDAPALVINLQIGGLVRTGVATTVLESRRPMVVFSKPASGHDWMYPYRWQKEGHRVALLATSDHGELERAAALLRVAPLLRRSRVLIMLPMQGTPASCSPEQIKERLGTELVAINQERFNQLLDAVDTQAAEAETERWLRGAKRVVEPQREDVHKAAKVSLAMDKLIDEEQAQALAIGTCMAWLPRGFPCLGFTRLRDRGIPASCEGDMDSLWTMLMFQYAFGIAGFQGNATFDTSRNALWTAHCVGPLKMNGPDGPEAPYLLRSHSEIGYGVVPEIQYRVGQEITRAKFVNLDTMLVSGGTIMEVPELSERACRTQIVTQVPNVDGFVRNWSTGIQGNDMMTLLHRVVFYGNRTQDLRHLGDLMGFHVVQEG